MSVAQINHPKFKTKEPALTLKYRCVVGKKVTRRFVGEDVLLLGR